MIKIFKVISMFSGCGGLDLGFFGDFKFLGKTYEKNLFEIIWANELNSAACKTYKKNFNCNIIEDDISEKIFEIPQNADLIIGGFPCQDISINGKMRGVDGKRSSLYQFMVQAVEKVNPKVFVVENVGGLLLKKNKTSFEKNFVGFWKFKL